jgi:hypothetical protein
MMLFLCSLLQSAEAFRACHDDDDDDDNDDNDDDNDDDDDDDSRVIGRRHPSTEPSPVSPALMEVLMAMRP